MVIRNHSVSQSLGRKAPGPDGVAPEAIKTWRTKIQSSPGHLDRIVVCSLLQNLRDKNFPKQGHLIKLPMKEGLQECKTWHEIMFSSAGRVLSRVTNINIIHMLQHGQKPDATDISITAIPCYHHRYLKATLLQLARPKAE